MLRFLIALVASLVLACSSTRSSEPLDWSPLQGLPQQAAERSVQLLHADLQLDLDLLDARLEGISTSWIRALGRPVRQVRLAGADGLREVLDARGRSLVFQVQGSTAVVELVEPLEPGEELPLAAKFSVQRPPGVRFGETARGPGWNPWVSAGPRGDQPMPWFPLAEPQQVCATFEARVRVGHGVRVLLGGPPSAAPSPAEADAAGTRTFVFRSDEPRALARLALAACRLRSAGDGPVRSRVFVPHTSAESLGERLASALGVRERGLWSQALQPAVASSGLAPAPPAVVVLPATGGQRLDGLGVISLGPALAERLAGGGRAAVPDPLALALARQRVAGRHTAARSSEAWLLKALAGFAALGAMDSFDELELEYLALGTPAPFGPASGRVQEDLAGGGEQLPSADLRKGVLLLEELAQEFGREALKRAIDQALDARRGDSLGAQDLVRAFQELDGRDLGVRLAQLSRRAGPPPWLGAKRAEALDAAGLRAAARQQTNRGLRMFAARRLVQEARRDPAVLTLLLEIASTDPSRRLRAAVIRELPADVPAARQFLLQALRVHPQPAARVAALDALWDAAEEDPDLVQELRSCAGQERDTALRKAYGDRLRSLRNTR